MVVKNFSLDSIHKSPLNNHLINFKKGKEIDYTYLYGSFFIDGNTFLPIEKNTLSTSLDMFTISYEKKFLNYFTDEHYNLLKNIPGNIKTIKNCFVIGNDDNYYHNLILYLPKMLFLINNKNLISNVENIIFNKSLSKKFIDFIDQILKLKNINKRLLLIDKKIYLLQKSYCPTILGRRYSISKNINFLENIGNELNVTEKLNNSNYKKIYISREDSKNRKILNEKELITFLKKIDFNIITLSKLDIFSQINIFKNAKIIIGYHGAGLANLVFTSSSAKLIEIHPRTKNDLREHFKIISSLKNIHHSFFFVDYKSNKEDSENLTYFDGIVDINKFEKFLKEHLN